MTVLFISSFNIQEAMLGRLATIDVTGTSEPFYCTSIPYSPSATIRPKVLLTPFHGAGALPEGRPRAAQAAWCWLALVTQGKDA
jgi:hypothetical protein